jgi:hypothetical protein
MTSPFEKGVVIDVLQRFNPKKAIHAIPQMRGQFHANGYELLVTK